MIEITVKKIHGNYLHYNKVADMNPRDHHVRTTTSNSDRHALMTLRDGAWILYMQYLNMRHNKKIDFSDEEVIKQFPTWTIRKLSNLRRLLIQEGWFYQVGGKLNNGKKFDMTYIGKEAVANAKAAVIPEIIINEQ